MKMMLSILFILITLIIPGELYATDLLKKDNKLLAGIIKLSRDEQIKTNKTSSFEFTLKSLPKRKQVRLYWDSRIECGSLGGNTPAMGVVKSDFVKIDRYSLI